MKSQNMCQEWLKRVPKGFLEYKHLKGPLGDFPATGFFSSSMDWFLFEKEIMGFRRRSVYSYQIELSGCGLLIS